MDKGKNAAPTSETKGQQKREDIHEKYDEDVILRIKEKLLKAMEEMEREGKETITIRFDGPMTPEESARAAERWPHVLKRYQERQKKRTAENRKTE